MKQNQTISLEDLAYGGTPDRFLTDEEIFKLVDMARMMDMLEVDIVGGKRAYLINYSYKDRLLLLPSNIRCTNCRSSRAVGTKYDNDKSYALCYNLKLLEKNLVEPEPYEYEINLKVIGGSGLVEATEMFKNLTLAKLDLKLFDTSKLKSTYGMFMCSDIKEIDLSNFNASKVKNMRYMFMGCKTNELHFDNFDTSNAKTMCGMFAYCNASQIDVSSFNMQNVIYTNKMFAECNASIIAKDPILINRINKDKYQPAT